MGMFDYVNFSVPCPKCGTLLSTFQSKDGPCDLVTVEPDEVLSFYDSCHKCKTWISYNRYPDRREPRKTPLTEQEVLALGFKRTVSDS